MIKLKRILNEAEVQHNYFYKGINPTVDLVIVRGHEILLVQRASDAEAFPDTWALPGGFQDTDAPKGAEWQPGKETAQEAAVREVEEEAKLDVSDKVDSVKEIGTFMGNGRDPRDTDYSWSSTTAFYLRLPDDYYIGDIEGRDDVQDAEFKDINEIANMKIAFDHDIIIETGLRKYYDKGET